MRPTIALTILLTLPLAGYDWLDRAEGKNPNKEYIERLALRVLSCGDAGEFIWL